MRELLAIIPILAASCAAPPPPVPLEASPAPRAEAPRPAEAAPDPPRTIEERLHAVHARAGRGRPAISEMHRETLEAGEERDFALRLSAGRCYTIIAVGSDAVTDLDLFLHDPEGFLVDWDRARDATPLLSTCLPRTATYRLRVKMYAGSGEFGLRVFGSPAQHRAPPEHEPVEIPLSEDDSPDSSPE